MVLTTVEEMNTTAMTLPEDAPVSFSSLPQDTIAEIALHVSGLRPLRSIVRFDVTRTASTRIQRAFRRNREGLKPEVHLLHVGDRVLYRPRPCGQGDKHGGIVFATADGEVTEGTWKIRLLGGSDMHVPTRRLYRLSPWEFSKRAPVSKAVTHAASAARGAATLAAQAALAVLHSPATTTGSEQIQLALAAASTASTAATAATAAASALVDATSEEGSATMAQLALQLDADAAMTSAHGMLEAHEQLMEAAELTGTASRREPRDAMI